MKYLVKEIYKFIFQSGLSLLDIFPDSPAGNRVRGLYLSLWVKGSRRNLQVSKRCHILYPQNITIGDNVYIGYCNWLNAMGELDIEDEVILGPFVKISTGDHAFLSGSFRFGEHRKAAVKIGYGCWLAGGVSVTKGVSICSGVLVAAGAVLTSSIRSQGIYGGVPAKHIGGTEPAIGS